MSGVPSSGVPCRSPKGSGRMPRLRHHHVAVAVGIDGAPLVGERRDEAGRVLVQVGHLLDEPPHVLVVKAVHVVAVAHPVEVGRVQRVPPAILEQAVPIAVGRDLGVPVKLSAQKPQRPSRRNRRDGSASGRCPRFPGDGPRASVAAGAGESAISSGGSCLLRLASSAGRRRCRIGRGCSR